MIVVSDTSPLRAMAHLGMLGHLGTLFGEVLVPPRVAAELVAPTPRASPIDARGIAGLQVVAPLDSPVLRSLLASVDGGEAEAIALAVERRADALLIDEALGRRIAARFGLTPIGALGVLVRCKNAGLIAEVAPLIQRLEIEIDFYVSKAVIASALRLAGEGAGPA